MLNQPKGKKAISISGLTRKIRTAVEDQIGTVWVEGEISNFRQQTSGHQYFSLKDKEAQIRCVQFRGNAVRNPVPLKDGMQVLAYGEVTVYEAQGQYQLIIRTVQPRGMGELQARFEALKRKLEAEGLFDQARKKKIPKLPKTVCLVTSPTSAAIRDMLNILSRRAPWVRVIVAPVRVQGDGAGEEIAKVIRWISRPNRPGLPPFDTIITGRGGGSIEDLWNFNEEVVARAIAECPIPIVSAVGHEIDFTISDFVADLRAPTPSAAAELVVPDRIEIAKYLERAKARLDNVVSHRIEHFSKVLELLAQSGAFREPDRVLSERRQRVDELESRLVSGSKAQVEQANLRVANCGRLLESSRPDRVLEQRREWLAMIQERLFRAPDRHLAEYHRKLDSLSSMIRTLGPESVLKRGFSLTTDEDGDVLTSVKQAKIGTKLSTQLADGVFESEITQVEPKKGSR